MESKLICEYSLLYRCYLIFSLDTVFFQNCCGHRNSVEEEWEGEDVCGGVRIG